MKTDFLYDIYFMLFSALLFPIVIFFSIAGAITGKDLDLFSDEELRMKGCGE
jgi:hypothetical protein